MYSIVPFTAGAAIAVGILTAFAPPGGFVAPDSPAIAQAAAAPAGAPPAVDPSGRSAGPGDLKGGGSSDGSTGPHRPDANLADGGDTHRQMQDKRLQKQQRDRTDPAQQTPAGK